jgi:hypothetical protein
MRRDHFAGQNQLQRAPLSDQSWQTLRSTAAGNHSQFHFWLSKLCGVNGNANGAGHCRFATATKRKTIDSCNHRLPKILDKIKNLLSVSAGLFRLYGGDLSEFANVSPSDECFIACSSKNGSTHICIISRIFEGRS